MIIYLINNVYRVSFSADAKEQRMVSTFTEQSAASHKKKRLRKPDTNVLSVKFNRLLQPGNLNILKTKIR